MAQLKKHWQGTSLAVVVVLLAALVWWQGAQTPIARADPDPPVALTEGQRSFVERVLAEISLDRDALVALNPSAQTAVSVLGTVRAWALSNEATVRSLSGAVEEKTQAVYRIEKAIAVGPFNELHAGQLEAARGELATAKAAYANAFVALKTTVSQALSAEQRSVWTAIQVGHGQQMPFRMLALNDTQRVALGDATRRYHARRAAAVGENELNAATTEWNNALGQILTGEQQTAINDYQSRHASASTVVNDAWNAALDVQG